MNKQLFENMRSQTTLNQDSIDGLKAMVTDGGRKAKRKRTSITGNFAIVGVCAVLTLIIGGTLVMDRFSSNEKSANVANGESADSEADCTVVADGEAAAPLDAPENSSVIEKMLPKEKRQDVIHYFGEFNDESGGLLITVGMFGEENMTVEEAEKMATEFAESLDTSAVDVKISQMVVHFTPREIVMNTSYDENGNAAFCYDAEKAGDPAYWLWSIDVTDSIKQ